MHQVNVRGTFLLAQAVHPAPREGGEPARAHALAAAAPGRALVRAAPRLHDVEVWDEPVRARPGRGAARAPASPSTALWPRTLIATSAIRNLLGGEEAIRGSRTPEIVADAAHAIFYAASRECTGHFFIDDEVLAARRASPISRATGTARASCCPTSSSDPDGARRAGRRRQRAPRARRRRRTRGAGRRARCLDGVHGRRHGLPGWPRRSRRRRVVSRRTPSARPSRRPASSSRAPAGRGPLLAESAVASIRDRWRGRLLTGEATLGALLAAEDLDRADDVSCRPRTGSRPRSCRAASTPASSSPRRPIRRRRCRAPSTRSWRGSRRSGRWPTPLPAPARSPWRRARS